MPAKNFATVSNALATYPTWRVANSCHTTFGDGHANLMGVRSIVLKPSAYSAISCSTFLFGLPAGFSWSHDK